MTYCTTDELVLLTGSAVSSTVLVAIIEQGDREIDAYLSPLGTSGAASGACKSASLKLAMAGLIDYSVQHGDRADSLAAGDTTETLKINEMIARYRADAFALLDQYVAASTSPTVRRYHIVKVNGL